MKSQGYRSAILGLAVFLTLPGFLLNAGAAPEAKTGATQANSTAKAAAPQEIPKSVFAIPATPKDGRNPFFPGAPQPVSPDPSTTATSNKTIDASGLVLNGITSPPKRTAMINGRTFEAGESGEVRLPNGSRVLLKCEEIRDNSALILIDGQRRELRLRFGL